MRHQKIFWALLTTLLLGFSAFALLDTFVIVHVESAVASDGDATPEIALASATPAWNAALESVVTPEPETTDAAQSDEESGGSGTDGVLIGDNSYQDGSLTVTLETIRVYDSTVYVAHIYLSDSSRLKSALAKDSYGSNVTETCSSIASRCGAVLAINGDYYGANRKGYVIKNGVLYRSTVRSDADYDDLAIYADGRFAIINEREISAEALIEDGVVQLLAFGPTLVENGTICVGQNEEVSQSMTSNPRTAIGMVESGHYVFVVSDGRTNESAGLTLYQLATVLSEQGCTIAYNLDGGGSSTMVFLGEVVNNPTTNGNRITERAVSDIVYVA